MPRYMRKGVSCGLFAFRPGLEVDWGNNNEPAMAVPPHPNSYRSCSASD